MYRWWCKATYDQSIVVGWICEVVFCLMMGDWPSHVFIHHWKEVTKLFLINVCWRVQGKYPFSHNVNKTHKKEMMRSSHLLLACMFFFSVTLLIVLRLYHVRCRRLLIMSRQTHGDSIVYLCINVRFHKKKQMKIREKNGKPIISRFLSYCDLLMHL